MKRISKPITFPQNPKCIYCGKPFPRDRHTTHTVKCPHRHSHEVSFVQQAIIPCSACGKELTEDERAYGNRFCVACKPRFFQGGLPSLGKRR